MRARVLLSLVGAVIAAVALVSASGAATTKAQKVTRIDVSTRAAVIHYLHSIHVKAKGAVIQRGLRNYAGARCPGKHWTCASTKHTVVQIAKRGGQNRFVCRSSRCAVVQFSGVSRGVLISGRHLASTPAAKNGNTATCIKTTGLAASCTITQLNGISSSASPMATIVEGQVAPGQKATGLTQTASYTAQITQSTGSGNNLACVLQETNIDGSTNQSGKKGTPITVTLEAHQSIIIRQDSLTGNNTAENATYNPSTGTAACASSPLSQIQTLSSTVTGTSSITQNENDQFSACPGVVPNDGDYANLCLDIEQNRSTGYKCTGTTPSSCPATGTNSADFTQTSTQTAIANTPVGSVTQTQSSVCANNPSAPSDCVAPGGLVGTINQDSRGPSTATPTQIEKQCEDAATSGLTACHMGSGDADFTGPYTPTQNQYGPVGVGKLRNHHRGRQLYGHLKGLGMATQTGFGGDTYTITQTSTQDNDQGSGSTQQNFGQADCHTSGNCTATQTTTVDGTPTTNSQTGQNVNAQTTCSGSACTTTRDVFVSVADGLIQEWDTSGATPVLVNTLDTGKGAGSLTAGLAFDPSGKLYSADFSSQDVSQFNTDGTLAGSFGGPYDLDPESIVFDSSGNAYVGQADGNTTVLEFSPSGTLLATFSPATEDRGTDWIDLVGSTLYYTSEGTSVKTFNVSTNTQGADFATGLPGPFAYAIKVLPDGGALVADSDRIVRLNSSGTVVQTYGLNAGATWFSLALDPGGTSFWAGDLDSGDVEEFGLSSGAVLASFNTGASSGDAAGGLAASH
jgi:hypothetical protein